MTCSLTAHLSHQTQISRVFYLSEVVMFEISRRKLENGSPSIDRLVEGLKRLKLLE